MYKMDFYFTDRQYNLLGIASTERGRFRVAGEIEAQSTTASTVALTGNIYFAKGDLDDAIAMVVGEGGNYILYEDDRGIGHFMTIVDTQVDNTGCSINFQADDAGNDLKDEIVGTYTASTAMTFAQYFNAFTYDSGWELGLNEIPTNTRTLEFSSEQTSYDRMLEVANDFGVSIYYTFDINGLEPVHHYLNVVYRLGSNTNITLRQGTDISQIVSETSTADLHTSIKAYGATPDGKTAPLNLAGYKWTDSTGQFALGGDGVLRDTIAIRTWSRLRSNTNPTPESSHLQWVKTYDATTQATLLQSALADLKTYNHPAVNYTVTMARVPSDLSKGDTVNVEDEAQNLYLSATVLEVDKCYSLPSSSTLTLGDFVIQHDQTSEQIKQAAKSAEDAVSKATTAFSYAATVETTASEASSTATQAQATANDAASKASEAQTNATAAQTTANTAQTTANTAKDTATAAAQAANTAQTTASSAATTASAAQKAANSARTFIKSANAPDTTNLPVNAVWLQPANGSTPASAKTWDGTTWQGTPIESSLIADNIVGKTITGSTVQATSGSDNGQVLNDKGLVVWKHEALTDAAGATMATRISHTNARVVSGLYWDGKTTFDSSDDTTLPDTYIMLDPMNADLVFKDALGEVGLTSTQVRGIMNCGTLLWSGGVMMIGSTTITPSIPLSQCNTGWQLIWSLYRNGNPVDGLFQTTFIPKFYVDEFSGDGLVNTLQSTGNAIAMKYTYVSDTTLKGNDLNGKSPNNNYVLREVRAV